MTRYFNLLTGCPGPRRITDGGWRYRWAKFVCKRRGHSDQLIHLTRASDPPYDDAFICMRCGKMLEESKYLSEAMS